MDWSSRLKLSPAVNTGVVLNKRCDAAASRRADSGPRVLCGMPDVGPESALQHLVLQRARDDGGRGSAIRTNRTVHCLTNPVKIVWTLANMRAGQSRPPNLPQEPCDMRRLKSSDVRPMVHDETSPEMRLSRPANCR
jgi:hypothetical protein